MVRVMMSSKGSIVVTGESHNYTQGHLHLPFAKLRCLGVSASTYMTINRALDNYCFTCWPNKSSFVITHQ